MLHFLPACAKCSGSPGGCQATRTALVAARLRGHINRQTFHLHDFQRIGCWAWAGAQNVIKDHMSVYDVFLEVVVFDVRQRIGQFDQFQVVRRNYSHAVLTHQGLNIGTTANLSLTVVRAFEDRL